jgi:hypothetical protein
MVLIWDGASYHRFGEFREYLAQVNQEKLPNQLEITCILFAPNAPQLLGSVAWSGEPDRTDSAKSGRRCLVTREEFLEKVLVFVQVILGCQKAV